RRQVLALKHFFSSRNCTVLLLDDRTSEPGDLQLHSIAHGVISLDQIPRDFGAERRRLRVVKMRGIKFRGGYHDFMLDTGGITVFPRLIAAEHRRAVPSAPKSTGSAELDLLLGGGLPPATNTLFSGPSGVGKTTTAVRCMMAALERGEHATYFLFDEGMATLISRSASLGMHLEPHIQAGRLALVQIDPAELSPGEFSNRVRKAVEQDGSTFIAVDSLNAYLQAMPGETFLLLQMHELLTYLNQQGLTTILVLGQHGLVGDIHSDVDLSYLSDAILLFRYFEAAGELRSAVSVVKSRTSEHERSIREFRLSSSGLKVGEALSDFQGVLTGLPSYAGKVAMLNSSDTPSRG
ncbi:MAG TPA: ATPase domain-containing protein, partial [Enterovirga sp.]